MTALHDFIQAAASYYGVPLDQLTEGSTLDTAQGDIELVLRVALTPEDVSSIAARMQRMALERKVDEAQAAEAAKRAAAGRTRHELRKAYNSLTRAERSAYGSFAKYAAAHGAVDLFATPEVVEKAELPPHVWLERGEVTEQQKAMAVGMDEKGRYAVDPADLTEQQRAQHLGVTSDAADFGGLPG